MYGWIWRQIPGPFLVRVLLLAGLLAGLVIICFQWVYPRISDYMPFNQGTVQSPSPTAGAATPGASPAGVPTAGPTTLPTQQPVTQGK